jgi:ribosomal protein S27AE
MQQANTALSETVVIARPRCPKCGARMWLTRIFPTDKVDYERRIYECPQCEHEVSEEVLFR